MALVAIGVAARSLMGRRTHAGRELPADHRATLRRLVLEPEPDLHRHLIVPDATLFEVAANLGHFEPVEVAQAVRGLLDRPVDGLGDALGRRAGDLDGLVDVIAHPRSIADGDGSAEADRKSVV